MKSEVTWFACVGLECFTEHLRYIQEGKFLSAEVSLMNAELFLLQGLLKRWPL